VQTDRLNPSMERSAQTATLALTLVICGLIWVLREPIATTFQVPQLVEIMPLVLGTFIFIGLTGPGTMLMNRDMRFKELAIAEFLSYSIGFGVLSVLLALEGFSYWSLIIGSFVQSILMCIAVFCLRPVFPTLRPSFEDLKPLLRFGGGMLLSQMLNNVARRSDNLVVANLLGPAALGQYSRGYTLMDMANQLFGSVFFKVLFPAFSKVKRTGGDPAKRLEGFFISHFAAAVALMPATVLTVILAPEIVLLLLGPQWTAAGDVLSILGVAMYFRLGYKVSGAFIAAEGAVYRGALRQLLYAVLVLAGAWVGAKADGLNGAAFGVLAAITAHFLMMTSLALHIVQGTWIRLAAALAPILLASGMAGGFTLFLYAHWFADFAVIEKTLACSAVFFLIVASTVGAMWKLKSDFLLRKLIKFRKRKA